jgi:hypothetical protein
MLADKGHRGARLAGDLPRHPRANQALALSRVIVENFFGRLSAKFHIMVNRWAVALVNFGLRRGGGSHPRAEDGAFSRRSLPYIRRIAEGYSGSQVDRTRPGSKSRGGQQERNTRTGDW